MDMKMGENSVSSLLVHPLLQRRASFFLSMCLFVSYTVETFFFTTCLSQLHSFTEDS
jgi:hypothetical protein